MFCKKKGAIYAGNTATSRATTTTRYKERRRAHSPPHFLTSYFNHLSLYLYPPFFPPTCFLSLTISTSTPTSPPSPLVSFHFLPRLYLHPPPPFLFLLSFSPPHSPFLFPQFVAVRDHLPQLQGRFRRAREKAYSSYGFRRAYYLPDFKVIWHERLGNEGGPASFNKGGLSTSLLPEDTFLLFFSFLSSFCWLFERDRL